jgi:acetoin utilization protein AcuC
MPDTLCLSWDRSLLAYNFGAQHPMSPIRLDLTARLIDEFGLFKAPGVRVATPTVADDALLRLVHTQDYIDAVRRVSEDWQTPQVRYGLGTPDDPCFPGMHEASARVVGATVEAARAVWNAEAEHGVSFAGGLHHAMPGNASGFCVYNDPAVAIAWLLQQGAERVAYVDIDVHHGDGVQTIFWNDPRVLTISIHEHPRTLFPGTGYPNETGGPDAEGSAVNLALPPGTTDAGWLRGFYAIVPPLLEAFRPTVLVSQHGTDSHVEDPLAHLAVTVDGQRAAAAALHGLAHELCEGRWVATGGGGYAVVTVVPRTWTHLVAEAAGSPIDPETTIPETWRHYVEVTYGRVAPVRMTDGSQASVVPFDTGYDPADHIDRAIIATRKAVFPSHGLDPHP